MHIAFITAGGAGMFCGSCMHDNTWARSLIDAGSEVSLLPTYTPIRVDEADASDRHVYMGGVNVYLNSRLPLWRQVPRAMKRVLDSAWLIRLVSRFSISNDAAKLGDLTLDMLAGPDGPHRNAYVELARGIAELKPDAVIFSNALLSGALPAIREVYSGPLACVLQGDDFFLDMLSPKHRAPAIAALSRNAAGFDRLFVHTRFYRDHMSRYLSLDAGKFELVPLGIDFAPHTGRPRPLEHHAGVVGYFARIAPEKGLHHLVDAMLLLKERLPDVKLSVGGYLGPAQRRYMREVTRAAAPLGSSFSYIGSPPTAREKAAFYQSFDVLSVPTDFLEPKGLYVLESLANGVPVVQPRHGSFPEIMEKTGGGLLVEPKNPPALADALHELLTNEDRRLRLAETGHERVRSEYSLDLMASRTLAAFESFLPGRAAQPTTEDVNRV
jgi:glycosyltransferase involved in cell wall biosynthesis